MPEKKEESEGGVTRRGFLGSTGAAMLAGLAGPFHAQPMAGQTAAGDEQSVQKASGAKMNMILFMPDEMRADSLACYGNPLTKTPNFDRLAQSGTTFENCHVQFPVCGASRCSLLTGWPTSVRGHRSLYYFLRPEEPNLFRYLRQAGYDVFWYGKNDALATESFYDSVTEWSSGGEGGGGNPPKQSRNGDTFIGNAKGERNATAEYKYLQSAIRILERRESDKPYCIFLPLSSPHPPYAAPQGFHDMYKAADIEGLRPKDQPRRPSHIDGIRKAYGLENVSDETFRQIRAIYYGMVSYSDWLMGELLEAVERTNHKNDTAVFLLSDHGDYAGDYGLVEKWPSGLEDPLTHVPLIAHVPGGTPGHRCKNMVELFDVMATCLDLAQTEAQHTHFARSLMPQLHGGDGDPMRTAFCEGGYNVYEPQCFELPQPEGAIYYPKSLLQSSQPQTVSRAAMIRTHEHKLVSRPQGQSELYFYKDDPQELHNRFGDRDVSETQHKLQEQLLHWYVNTTGVPPFDKNQREAPPFYPTRTLPETIESRVRTVLDPA